MIDEKKLIEEIEKLDLHGRMKEYEGLCAAVDIIKNQPKVGDWIPCSERLPEDKQRCLTTAKIYFVPDHVDEEDNYIGVAIDTYFKKFGWFSNPEVIAWQPLPQPFQR